MQKIAKNGKSLQQLETSVSLQQAAGQCVHRTRFLFRALCPCSDDHGHHGSLHAGVEGIHVHSHPTGVYLLHLQMIEASCGLSLTTKTDDDFLDASGVPGGDAQ